MTDRTCPGCLREVVNRHHWFEHMTKDERRVARAEGKVAHARGGMCDRCSRRDANGLSIEVREHVSRETMLAEYDFYKLHGRSQRENCRRTADALGVSWKTVERAVVRAKKEATDGVAR